MQQLISELLKESKFKSINLVLNNGENINLKAVKVSFILETNYLAMVHMNRIDYIPYSSIVKISTLQ